MLVKSSAKRGKKFYFVIITIGLVLMAAGALAGYEGFDGRLIGFGSGLGSAAAALGAVGLITLRRSPEDQRRQEINARDERFVRIREKAAYSTFYVTLIGLAVVELILVALNLLTACFILIGLMAVHVVSYFVFLYRYNERDL